MEGIINDYEEKFVLKPDARIEYLRNLSVQKSRELKELISDVSKSSDEAERFKTLIQEYDDIMEKTLDKYYDIDRKKAEIAQDSVRPKILARDIVVGLVVSFIWLVITAVFRLLAE
jgi:hypothetical protein